jgi:hypothetical protein
MEQKHRMKAKPTKIWRWNATGAPPARVSNLSNNISYTFMMKRE